MPSIDMSAIAYALACAWCAFVGRDLGRRWIGYRERSLVASEDIADVRARLDVSSKAIAKLAKDFDTALDMERKRINALESVATAEKLNRGTARTTQWRTP